MYDPHQRERSGHDTEPDDPNQQSAYISYYENYEDEASNRGYLSEASGYRDQGNPSARAASAVTSGYLGEASSYPSGSGFQIQPSPSYSLATWNYKEVIEFGAGNSEGFYPERFTPERFPDRLSIVLEPENMAQTPIPLPVQPSHSLIGSSSHVPTMLSVPVAMPIPGYPATSGTSHPPSGPTPVDPPAKIYPPYDLEYNVVPGTSSITADAFSKILPLESESFSRHKARDVREVITSIFNQVILVHSVLYGNGEPSLQTLCSLMGTITAAVDSSDLRVRICVYSHHHNMWLDLLKLCYRDGLQAWYRTVFRDGHHLTATTPTGRDRDLRSLFDLLQSSREVCRVRTATRLEHVVKEAEWLVVYTLGHIYPQGKTNWAVMGKNMEKVEMLSLLALVTATKKVLAGWIPDNFLKLLSNAEEYPDVAVQSTDAFEKWHTIIQNYHAGAQEGDYSDGGENATAYLDAFMAFITDTMEAWHSGV